MCHHNRRARRARRPRRERRQGALGMLAAYIITRYEEKRALEASSKEHQDQHQPETVLLHGEQAYGRTIPAEENTYRSEWVEEKGVMGNNVVVTDGEREEFAGTAPPTYGQAMRER